MNTCFVELDYSLSQPDSINDNVLKILEALTNLMRCPKSRSDLTEDQWAIIVSVVQKTQHILSQNDHPQNFVNFLIELLRFLRNSCGGLNKNQCFILNNKEIFNFSKDVLRNFLQRENQNDILVLKIVVQLFGNLLVANEESKPLVWRIFFGDNTFRYLFQHQDLSVREFAMMVLFNCMTNDICKDIFNSPQGHELLVCVTDTLLMNQIDWGMLFLEFVLNHDGFWNCYGKLPFQNRLLILDIIAARLKISDDDNWFCIPVSLIDSLKNVFLKKLNQLYNATQSDIEPEETVTMLNILCSASIVDTYISVLQNSTELIQISVDALKCIHLLGREGCNEFSSLTDIKWNNAKFSAEIACHPMYCFKKNLIRLIGNLSYNCRNNQDIVRCLDGIPLILDCCKFDARNPYITQWCILAIRNLLENNSENQAVLAGMTVSGDLVDSKLLKEMGLHMQCSDGKFHLSVATPTSEN